MVDFCFGWKNHAICLPRLLCDSVITFEVGNFVEKAGYVLDEGFEGYSGNMP